MIYLGQGDIHMGRHHIRPFGPLDSPGYSQQVANPSVETGASEPDNWFHTLTGTEWANGEAHTGTRSLRVNVANDVADWRASVFPVVGGRSYHLGLWIKGTGTPQMVLAARWFSDTEGANYITEEWLTLGGVFAGWTHKGHVIVAPANALSGDIMFRAAFATTVDIYGDDFLMRRLN